MVHFTISDQVSAIGIGVGLFLPIWSTDAIWSLTRVSVLVQFSRYLFWVRSLERLTAFEAAQAQTLEDASALEGWRGLFLNAPLSRDFLEGCGAAFFLFFADTLLDQQIPVTNDWTVLVGSCGTFWAVPSWAESSEDYPQSPAHCDCIPEGQCKHSAGLVFAPYQTDEATTNAVEHLYALYRHEEPKVLGPFRPRDMVFEKPSSIQKRTYQLPRSRTCRTSAALLFIKATFQRAKQTHIQTATY
ncbi:hypothetical protein AK812_SmicGene31516 [Symbiodinium microadriaticum]|uniref:Uncharacterized protein n=1 Tax=Symbiodinium microadriaticum TaxID=2951 RepID=A0A1Q9CWI6_SYMMI|nr:hypothetical protein AK812_SmicGene31516 [Symbiodinium microadriaticum]